MTAYTRLPPTDRIAVEGRLLGVEVFDLVFDPQDVHILPPRYRRLPPRRWHQDVVLSRREAGKGHPPIYPP